MLDFQYGAGRWGRWHRHDGRGCPTWIKGMFVHVRTIDAFSGTPRSGLDGYGVAGVTIVRSFIWTERSRLLPPWHREWTEAQPVDAFRIWLREVREDAMFGMEGAA